MVWWRAGAARKFKPNYSELFANARLDELCEPGEAMNDFLLRFTVSHPAEHADHWIQEFRSYGWPMHARRTGAY